MKSVKNNSLDILYFVTNEVLFDIFNLFCTSIGHIGRYKMVSDYKKYCNITKEAITTYLKRKFPTREIIIKSKNEVWFQNLYCIKH